MNTTIGVYKDHELAVSAVKKLKDAGVPVSHITIMGMAETEKVDENLDLTKENPLKLAGVGTGVVAGATLGVLTGIGIFAIPGVGFLYGAGALIGAIAGIDFGLIGGSIASVLTTIGVKDHNEKKYHDLLQQGKFLVIVHGKEEEVNTAKELLHSHGSYENIDFH